MSLSDDQRALLRLLAKREEGYEDIAALKGLSVEALRAEVNDALAELNAPPPEPLPPPPAPTPRPVSAPTDQARRRFALLTGGALAVVAIVLGAIALIGGGGDDGSSSSATTAGSETELTAAESGKVTQAVLTAADGSDASGRAVFGRVGKKEIVLQVTAENLEPTEEGESYTVWLYRSPKLTLRVGGVAVGESGQLGARFPIPAELLAYVASGAFDQIYVSRTSDAAYRQEVATAKKNKSLPRYTGDTVLTGEITGPVSS